VLQVICIISISLLIVLPSVADSRFESAWAKCGGFEGDFPPPTEQQIAACNVVIAAGKAGGGVARG
jgi:hypothetical protein